MRNVVEIEATIFRKTNKKIEYLIFKRTKPKGNFWQPLSGGSQANETLLETLKRELKEETEIEENQIKRIIKNVYRFEWVHDSLGLIKNYCFGVEVEPNVEIKLSEEHSKFKWCSFEEAMKLLKWDGNKTTLFKLNEILRG